MRRALARRAGHRPHPRPAPPGVLSAAGLLPRRSSTRCRPPSPRADRRPRSRRSSRALDAARRALPRTDGRGERRCRHASAAATSPMSAMSASRYHLEVPLRACRARSAGAALPRPSRGARPHLRPCAAGADPHRESARGASAPPRREHLHGRLDRPPAQVRTGAQRAHPAARAPEAVEAAVYDRAALQAGDTLSRPRDHRAGRHHDPGRAGLALRRSTPAATWCSSRTATDRVPHVMSAASPASPSGPALDPITVEVIRNKLDGIANEMELDAAAQLLLADREGRARRISQPVHAAGRDAGAGGARSRSISATLIPVRRAASSRVPARDDARGRHLHA